MALILDIETNGLPDCPGYGFYPLYTNLKKYSSARVVQVSYIITNNSLEKLEENDFVIRADGFTIQNSEFHGITNEISENVGIPFVQFANYLNNSLDFVSSIISHNINFDINVLKAELYRHELIHIINKIETKKTICTMKTTKSLVGATFKNPNIFGKCDIKDPSLKELYFYATGKEIENQHNSLYDTINLWKCIISDNLKSIFMDLIKV